LKILYGVCGEGRGHASRSLILIHYLQQKGHEVCVVAGGKAYTILSEEFDRVLKIESPQGFYKENRVRILYTLLHTTYQTITRVPVSFFKIRQLLQEFQPDVLITDAEPISHIAARFRAIKRVSIDNPTALLYRKIPKKIREYPAWLFLFFALKFSLFGAKKYIIYDFFEEQLNNPRVLFVKPLIQPGIRRQTSASGDYLFVYQTSLTFTSLFTSLKNFDETFIIYGFNKDMTDENLIFKRFNDDEFYHDLASAKAVIVNGGFTVISEALYLKKPIFSLPIRHQFEQAFNAKCIERMGVGISHPKFCENDLKDFLDILGSFQENLQKYDAGVQEEILARIEQEIQNVFVQKR
jgi:uncharacterized protein (TIGR00661 family)